jgi:hypothetical protein
MREAPPADLDCLWIGGHLGWLPRLCLSTWVRHGHRVTLWAYEPIDDVPDGVNVEPGQAILPATAITRHRKTGSVSLFSNRFRYHLLSRRATTWLDTDVVLLRPLDRRDPYLFGRQDAEFINTAVLRLPGESPVLADLKAFADARVPVPAWWSPIRKGLQRALGVVGMHQRAPDMGWGTFGPRALTDAIRRHELDQCAAPPEVFYPLGWREAALFYGPAAAVDARITPATVALHLWQSTDWMRAQGDAPPPEGSFLAEMCTRYAIDCRS